jgi:hypothetical protein
MTNQPYFGGLMLYRMGAHDLLGYTMENSMFLFKYMWSHENYVGICVCTSRMFNAIERFPMI